jgi:alpha-N-arabinofuranosidase
MHLSTIRQNELRKLPLNVKTKPEHPAAFTPVPVVIDARLEASPAAGPISNKLYSGFIEHLGRCIYGGLVDDPRDPSPKELLVAQDDGTELTAGRLGWRSDVQKVLAADGELKIPMMRWPGGNFVSNYHWQDGVGPIAARPHRTELAWLGNPETNAFGTNEFIDLCRANGWEPYICLNMGSGTYEEA